MDYHSEPRKRWGIHLLVGHHTNIVGSLIVCAIRDDSAGGF